MKDYIIGNIKKIIYESNNNPYKVCLFKVKETNSFECKEYVDKIINITGYFVDINYDLDYTLYGKLIEHNKYGLQFQVESYEIKEPTTIDSIILYLSSGVFKGIGEKSAKKIVEYFGEDTLDIIRNDYTKLTMVPGISESKAFKMHIQLEENSYNQDVILKLTTYGFTVKEAISLISKYNSRLLSIVEDNIYELNDIISFEKLDTIFLSRNLENHPYRIEALIKHDLNEICFENGDTLVDINELYVKMLSNFKSEFNSATYLSYINKLCDKKEIYKVNDMLILRDFYNSERNIYRTINIINSIKNRINTKKLDDEIYDYQIKNKINFSKEQIEAIKGSIKNNFYIITGGPGTGKTTIVKAVVKLLKETNNIQNRDIALLAPTGRSAKRLAESVGVGASTIHKFLKWNKESETFQLDEYNKACEKVIIIDEVSMIDVSLFDSLLKALNNDIKLLLIGDENQLPSIKPGDILYDLLRIEGIKSKCLKTIYRVKDGSYITKFANEVKDKKIFDEFDEYVDFKFIKSNDSQIMEYLEIICNKIKDKNIGIDNFQVLAPMYKGLNGIDALNEMMGKLFNSENKKVQVGDNYYRINDKVIQLVNDVDNNVFNGDIGYISDIYKIEKKTYVEIDFIGNKVTYTNGEFDRFSLAYAISIHKAQGSEYDNVVIILAGSFKRMFYNKLIYTGITRAKKSLMIIGNIDSLNTSVQTSYAQGRKTYLKTLIKE